MRQVHKSAHSYIYSWLTFENNLDPKMFLLLSYKESYKETCRAATTMRFTLKWPVILNRSCYFSFKVLRSIRILRELFISF